MFRPFARMFLRSFKQLLKAPAGRGLITGSRVALGMWEGVHEKKWSFISPPGLLRDKGTISKTPLCFLGLIAFIGIRTGQYEYYIDDGLGSAQKAIDEGIYNEDMAVAIVDEVENGELIHKHWSCTGPIGLKEW
jgi:putative NADH-flavin reductase